MLIGQLIYNISQYSSEHNRFVAYIGVDASRPDVASIKIKVSVSDDGKTWNEVIPAKDVYYAKNECLSVDVDITGKSYLKITVNDAGNGISSDHCSIADAKLVKADYKEENYLYSGIKKLDVYDAEIRSFGEVESICDDNTKLQEVLKREFVRKLGYWNIQNSINSNENVKKAVDWILNNKEVLELVIEVGEITDSNAFLEALGNLYVQKEKYIEDSNKDRETYLKMMIALAATWSSDNIATSTSFGMQRQNYNYLERFDIMKDLFDGYVASDGKTYKFDTSDLFKRLNVDLMRNVMNTGTRNDEIKWLNYHTSIQTKDKFLCHHYLKYSGFKIIDDYFTNKTEYDNKYRLLDFGVPFGDDKTPRVWMVLDSGGICWNIGRIGQQVNKVNGRPAVGLYQPGHELLIAYEEDSQKRGLWKIQYSVSSWGKAGTTWGGGSRYRIPLDWANKPFADQNISGSKGGSSSGYAILAQANLNDYNDYKKSLYYNLVANSYTDNNKKYEIYDKALKVGIKENENNRELNLDSFEGIINVYENIGDVTYNDEKIVSNENGITAEKWYELCERIINSYTYYPNAMSDLLKIIKPHLNNMGKEYNEASGMYIEVEMNESEAYKKALKAKGSDSIQWSEIRDLAYYFAHNTEKPIATFSFDGAYANKIVIDDQYAINWQYSIDGGNKYSELTTSKVVELNKDELKNLNEDDDIKIKMTGTDKVFTIDLEVGWFYPGYECYGNDIENRIAGADDSMEWCFIHEEDMDSYEELPYEVTWTKFKDKLPNLVDEECVVRVRAGATGTTLPSILFEDFKFTKDEKYNEKRSYVSSSNLNVVELSEGTEVTVGAKENCVDGSYASSMETSTPSDIDPYIVLKLNYPTYVSAIEYVIDYLYQEGRVLEAEVYGKLNETDDWKTLALNQKFTYDKGTGYQGENPNYGFYADEYGLKNTQKIEIGENERQNKVQYIKIVVKKVTSSKESGKTDFNVRMINVYEDITLLGGFPAPSATIEYSTSRLTNGDVIAKVDSTSAGSVKIEGDINRHVFTDNGTYTFNLVDTRNGGKKGTVTAEVDWIDKKVEKPIINYRSEGYTETGYTNSEIFADITPTEDIVILDTGLFSINEKNQLILTKTNKEGVQEEVLVRDFTTAAFDEEVDKTKPVAGLVDKDFHIDENKNVVNEKGEILVKADEGLFEKNFIDNGTYEIKYVDRAGNIGTEEILIDKIDNIAPIGYISYDISSSTDESVTATVEFEEEGVTIVNNDGKNTFVFDKNGDFTFQFKDKAGNTGTAKAEVTWISQTLKSEKFDINNLKIKKVNPNCKLKEFLESLVDLKNAGMSVVDKSGNNLTDDKYVATGMKLKVGSSEYTIIVTNDVDGDGELTNIDLEKLCNHYLGKEQLENEYLEAGDTDNNGLITLKDIAKMYSLLNNSSTKSINTKLKLAMPKSEVAQGEEIIAYIKTSDLEEKINAIGGNFEYDKNYMELVSIKSENSNWDVKENDGKFIALRKEASKVDEEVIKLEFKVKEDAKGHTNLTLKNLQISDGKFEKDTDENTVNIEVIENLQKVPVESVKIASTSEKFKDGVASIEVGEDITFHTIVEPYDYTETNLVWSLEKGAEEFIDISQDGKVTAKKVTDENGVKVIATIDGKSAECIIKVIPTEVTGMSEELTNNNIYLVEPNAEGTGDNTSVTVIVNVLPDNATDKRVTWETSDETVATVKDGVITAVSDNDHKEETRTCTITVKSVSNPSVYKEYKVHVNDHLVKVKTVEIQGERKVSIKKDAEIKLHAIVGPDDATDKTVTWESSNNEVVSVTDGILHAKKVGTAKITAKAGEISDNITVEVVDIEDEEKDNPSKPDDNKGNENTTNPHDNKENENTTNPDDNKENENTTNPDNNKENENTTNPDDDKENESTTNSDDNKDNGNISSQDDNKQNGNTASSDSNKQNRNAASSDGNKQSGGTASSDGNKQNGNTASSDSDKQNENIAKSDGNKQSGDTTSSDGNKQNGDMTTSDNNEESGITTSPDDNKENESVTPNDNKENPIIPNGSKENESPTISSSSKFSDLTQNNNKQNNSKTASNNQGSVSLVLPKTSDIEIKAFVIMMVISFIGIVFIIYKKYKK